MSQTIAMLPMRRWYHYFDQKGLMYEFDAWQHFSPKQRRRYMKKKYRAVKKYADLGDQTRQHQYLSWCPLYANPSP